MSDVAKFTVSGRSSCRAVNFKCPWCQVPLSSPLSDAGKPDKCPRCGCDFLTPGREIMEKEAALEAKKKAEKKPVTTSRLPLLTVGLFFGGVVGLIVGGLIIWHYFPRGERGAASNVVTARASDGASMARVESRPATATEKKSPPAFATTSPQTAQKKLTQREI